MWPQSELLQGTCNINTKERVFNKARIHPFDTGTTVRCISLRADVELESKRIASHK
ncbi:hypothetical protein SynBIOSE41_01615 [Synechococcus sp. BIOS-E4-1]|nr:hypothetical protein SynBIOSE41_01615 [Synechococcus sp. BIOS-E4-1]